MGKRFEGKTAWITGGGTGIGKALAIELAREGADVAVSGRRVEKLAETIDAIEQLGQVGVAVPCDVTDEQDVSRTVDAVHEQLGRLDVAVANAGFGVVGPVETLTAEDWRRQLDVNVVGAALTAKHALAYLRESKGRLGLVGSVAGFVPLAKNGAYVASKWAVRGLGATLAVELAGSGVSCTTMHPGFVESDIHKVDNAGNVREDKKDKRPQNLLWPTDKAARVMARALHRRRTELVFTGHGKVGAFLGQHFPGLTVLAMSRGRR